MTKELGLKLKQLRVENGFTQTYVGAKLNIGNKTISDYERGVSEPDTTTLKDFASLYGVTVDEILGNTKPLVDDFSFALHGTFDKLSDEDKKKILEYAELLANKSSHN